MYAVEIYAAEIYAAVRQFVFATSNLPFEEWASVFGSERLTGALLDRLTHHVQFSRRVARQGLERPPSPHAQLLITD